MAPVDQVVPPLAQVAPPLGQVVPPVALLVAGLPQQGLSDLSPCRQVFPAGPWCLWYLLLAQVVAECPSLVAEWSCLVAEWSSLVAQWSSAGPLRHLLPLRP